MLIYKWYIEHYNHCQYKSISSSTSTTNNTSKQLQVLQNKKLPNCHIVPLRNQPYLIYKSIRCYQMEQWLNNVLLNEVIS